MATEDVASEKKAGKQCGNRTVIKVLCVVQAVLCG
jgi:hypothetical protein